MMGGSRSWRSGGYAYKQIVVIVARVAAVAKSANPLDNSLGVEGRIALNGMVMELDEDLTEGSEIVFAGVSQEFILGTLNVQFEDVGRVQTEMFEQSGGGDRRDFISRQLIAKGVDVVGHDGAALVRAGLEEGRGGVLGGDSERHVSKAVRVSVGNSG